MTKIMLVIDNPSDQEFLEKLLRKLSYEVVTLDKGLVLSEQLLDHFPDVLFASTLGRNQKILAGLAKIKAARGKPKLVFVRQEKEGSELTEEQQTLIDGVLFSPIDPFKLIDVLVTVTSAKTEELRDLYGNSPASKERKNKVYHEDIGTVRTMGLSPQKAGQILMTPDTQKVQGSAGDIPKKTKGVGRAPGIWEGHQANSDLNIYDLDRRKKYDKICKDLNAKNKDRVPFDPNQLKEMQEVQSKQVHENPEIKNNRKHFLKTLFAIDPEEIAEKNKS